MARLALAMMALVMISAVKSSTTQENIDWGKVSSIDMRDYMKNLKKTFPPKTDLEGRIVGGEEATPLSHPYVAALVINGISFCGGSLINNQWILTAAHCVENFVVSPTNVVVILGAHNVMEKEEGQVHMKAENIVIHPKWNSRNLNNDIALVRLNEPVKFTDTIQPILLADKSERAKAGTIVSVNGWGKKSDDSTGISNTVMLGRLQVISIDVCKNYYSSAVTSKHMCTTGMGGKGTCSGDSGGPLVVNSEDSGPIQLGIVSFGASAGCEEGYPSVYTRVSSYVKWVEQNTKK